MTQTVESTRVRSWKDYGIPDIPDKKLDTCSAPKGSSQRPLYPTVLFGYITRHESVQITMIPPPSIIPFEQYSLLAARLVEKSLI